MKMLAGKRELDKLYKRRDRYQTPDWQRGKVWTTGRKQKLIDSILRGWNLPKFYFVSIPGEPEEWEVVDGQQRLMAIFEFCDNDLSLSKESEQRFGGRYYADLPPSVTDEFDDFEIEFDLIEEAEEKELKEFFKRLQAGLQLTSSERLNAVHSSLTDFCRNLAEHRFLKNKTAVSNHRYGLLDVVCKVAAIEIEGIDVGLRYDDLEPLFESQANFSEDSNIAKRLNETFNYLDRAFPKKEPKLRNRTIVQSLATLTASIIAAGKSAGYEPKLRGFFTQFLAELSRQVELGQQATELDYVTFQKTVSQNRRSGARTRQEILLRELLLYDPASTELFGPSVIAESGIEEQIRGVAESTANLIVQINENYAVANGEDLFKTTNKTTKALGALGRTVKDYDDYRSFIDHLYFVFHEGPGQRLKPKPTSFSDVNGLRTDLGHDVNHGKASRVVGKRKKLGATFRKYAGGGTPGTLAPERFPALQAALLKALEADLRALLKQVQ